MVNYSAQFSGFFTLNLNNLKTELLAYKDEANIWKTDGNISNSAGNLTLHLIGNLNHFFGATLGHTGFIRDRDSEFSNKSIARAVIIEEIDKTIAMMEFVYNKLDNDALERTFPLRKHDKEESTAHFIIHLFGHFTYHLGQINYHRRLLDL
ncbi:MAG: DinB family protein [Bacteroidetes bacterium]|nr:DinB family protein [Bacteroidota bacterium]